MTRIFLQKMLARSSCSVYSIHYLEFGGGKRTIAPHPFRGLESTFSRTPDPMDFGACARYTSNQVLTYTYCCPSFSLWQQKRCRPPHRPREISSKYSPRRPRANSGRCVHYAAANCDQRLRDGLTSRISGLLRTYSDLPPARFTSRKSSPAPNSASTARCPASPWSAP